MGKSERDGNGAGIQGNSGFRRGNHIIRGNIWNKLFGIPGREGRDQNRVCRRSSVTGNPVRYEEHLYKELVDETREKMTLVPFENLKAHRVRCPYGLRTLHRWKEFEPRLVGST
jgi:hypothetical protein